LEILTVGKDIDPLIHVSGVSLVVSARPNMGGNPRSIKTEGPSPYEWMFGNIYSSVGYRHAGDVRLVTRKVNLCLSFFLSAIELSVLL
jgi:hypothetical protein